MSVTGHIVRRPVDQTPASKFYRNPSGFFEDDITLLLQASQSGDKGRFEQLISRLQMFDDPGNKKTIQQLFDEWKPLTVQTASEEQAWIRYVKEFSPDLYDRLYPEGEKTQDVQDSKDNASVEAD